MLGKTYEPREVEARIYAAWEASGLFRPSADAGARPYCIVLPPPNVTGSLHMGHALDHTLQDVLIRFHRMRGRSALWQPGTDHAGIATQMVVERELAKDGRNIGRRDMGRGRNRALPVSDEFAGHRDGRTRPRRDRRQSLHGCRQEPAGLEPGTRRAARQARTSR